MIRAFPGYTYHGLTPRAPRKQFRLPASRWCALRVHPRACGILLLRLVSATMYRDPRKFQHEFGMISAAIPYTLADRHEDNDVPTFWSLLYGSVKRVLSTSQSSLQAEEDDKGFGLGIRGFRV